jgi:hypothetical protein
MTRAWTRLFQFALVVCLSVVADASASGLCLNPCSTEGEWTFIQDGCCPPLAWGPTIQNREYVCHAGCYQATSKTECTNQACLED